MLSGMVYKIMRSYPFSRILICLVLCLGLVFGSALPSFASSDGVTPAMWYQAMRTDQAYYLTGTNGNSTTISIYSGLIKVLAMFAGNNSEHLYNLGQLITTTNSRLTSIIGYIDGIEGYVDGVESTLTNIYNKLPSSSWFTNISGYLDGLEGYVDGLETAMSTNNSRLSSILSAIQNLATDFGLETSQGYIWTKYDGTQSTITQGTSITDLLGMLGGAQGENLSGFYSLISGNFDGNEITTNWAWHDTTMWRDVSSSYLPLLNLNSHAYLNTYPYQSSNLSLRGLLTAIIRQQYFTATAVRSTGANQYIRGYLNNSQYNEGQPTSVLDGLQYLSMALGKPLGRIQYFLADDDSIQRKQNNASLTSGALDQITGEGSAAASLSDFTSVSSGLGDIKSSVSGGASASSAFAVLNGGSNAWDWFSEDCQNDMDTTQGSSSSSSRGFKSVRFDSSSSTPLLDQYYTSVLSFLGGGSDD